MQPSHALGREAADFCPWRSPQMPSVAIKGSRDQAKSRPLLWSGKVRYFF